MASGGGSKELVRRTVMVSLGGQRYRVVTTGTDEELARLVGMVESKAREVGGRRGLTPDCVLLTAIAFAYEAETQRSRADRILEKASGLASGLLREIEEVVGEDGEDGDGATEETDEDRV